MSDNRKKPEILEAKLVAQSRLFKIEQVHLRFANGAERFYERMRGNRSGAVMIVALQQDGSVLLAQEYCAGTDSYEWGFPKGLIDPGESPAEAANRELQEEMGFGAKRWTELKQVALAPGYFASKMHIFLAEELYSSWLEGDEPEPLGVKTVARADWDQLLDQDDFIESRSVAALMLAQRALAKRALAEG
ncbi:ADP compounds hydrolase NudE [Paraferrimonas sedimenticola]|uniref:ADP compounds hydrolase NudE n=1 Tax=Paraferrimonas sedimenticola TaxID=375674 RepID=A0AA37RW96_9GAMM|nr:ADP compounds hydrolase NudE [Paraferrimonas sedimenticola]GLP95912.1 ADP compounds hydrolase NudE [Paraferrimonas sedimenticola]